MATATASTLRSATEDGSVPPRQPGVSVIIPAYNYAQFLSKAIASVFHQTGLRLAEASETEPLAHAVVAQTSDSAASRSGPAKAGPPFELIIVDDGSTDNTRDAVAQYGDRVRYVYQTNAGLAAARNTGIRAARFDYLAFLDADDEWLPGFLSTLMAKFTELPDAFAVVACREIYVNANGQPFATKRLTPAAACEITCRDILLKTQFAADAVIVKRAAFDQCGFFDDTMRSSEDRDMWSRIAAQRRIFLLADRLVLIRKHGGNMSRHADRMKRSGRRVINKGWAARLVPHRCAGFWLQVLSFHFYQAAWMYHEERRRGCALRDLFKSLLVWPWFFRPQELNEPVLLRLRSLRHFLLGPRDA
jgi:glycosyltransferase involved in cell wall biosynthesis